MNLRVWFNDREYEISLTHKGESNIDSNSGRLDFNIKEVMDVQSGIYEINSDIIEDDEFLDAVDLELRGCILAGEADEECSDEDE